MILVHLVRHAAHGDLGLRLTGRGDGVALSEAGRAEAALLAQHLASTLPGGDAEAAPPVRTSPRLRTVETGRAIADALGARAEMDAHLDEIDFGHWTGQDFGTLAHDLDWQRWNASRGEARTPAGDTMQEAGRRLLDAAADLARRTVVARAPFCVLVSHADPIRAAVALHLGAPLGAYARFDIDPASLTTLAWSDGQLTLRCLNATSHLAETAHA